MEALFTWILPLANALGLGLLGWGLFHFYRTLLDRNKSLVDHINEVKTGHTNVVEVMQRRAEELEHRFDDEKRWRTNIVEVVGLTEQQQKKLVSLKDEENQQLRSRCAELTGKLQELQGEVEPMRRQIWETKKLETAKQRLEVEKKILEDRIERLTEKVGNLENSLARALPRGLRGVS